MKLAEHHMNLLTVQITEKVKEEGKYKLYIGQDEEGYDFLLQVANKSKFAALRQGDWITLVA